MSSVTERRYGLQNAPPPLVWRSWPLRDEPRQALLFFGLQATVGLIVWSVTQHVSPTLLAMVALTGALWRLWLPVSYELDTKGVRQRIWRHWRLIPWHAIRRCKIRRDGLLILRRSETGGDALRGFFLPWQNHRDAVLAQAEYYLEAKQIHSRHRVVLREPGS